MGGTMSRNKGQRGEREVIKLLQPTISLVYGGAGFDIPALERNLMQSNNGGFDLTGLDWLALEVKYQEQEQVKAWWLQTVRQAGLKREPVLFYRRNNVKWRVRMFGYLIAGDKRVKCPVDISVEAFLAYFKKRLTNSLNNS